MAITIWNLYKSGLLLTNSALILHRKRFLAKYGLDPNGARGGLDQNESQLKVQIRGFMGAIEYLRVPVIALNTVTVIFEMLLGGA